MRLTSPSHQRPASGAALAGPQTAFLAAAFATFGFIGLLSLHWPAALLLPMASVALLASAIVVAVLAWRLPKPRADGVTYWDVSGALTLAGICAALFSEPDQVIPLIESASRPQFAKE